MFLSCNLRVKNKLNMDYSNLSKTGCQMGFFLLLLICLHWLVMGIFGRASDPTETRSPPPFSLDAQFSILICPRRKAIKVAMCSQNSSKVSDWSKNSSTNSKFGAQESVFCASCRALLQS